MELDELEMLIKKVEACDISWSQKSRQIIIDTITNQSANLAILAALIDKAN
jgi:hypothetical protein